MIRNSWKQWLKVIFFVLSFLLGRDAMAGVEVDAIQSTSQSDIDVPYNPRTALYLSLIPTVATAATGAVLLGVGYSEDDGDIFGAGLITGGAGLALGPSVGHFYSRSIGRGILSITVSPVLSFGAIVCLVAGVELSSYPNDIGWYTASTIFLLSDLAFSGFNIFTAPRAARKANEEYREESKKPLKVSLLPAAYVSSNKKTHYGLQLLASF